MSTGRILPRTDEDRIALMERMLPTSGGWTAGWKVLRYHDGGSYSTEPTVNGLVHTARVGPYIIEGFFDGSFPCCELSVRRIAIMHSEGWRVELSRCLAQLAAWVTAELTALTKSHTRVL